uniref:Uncharacterized protein n=1 Tax=Podoviridae sp. ctuQh21 TaxID=2825284 RepID=A0A8S5PGL8_9CAUD|nr:MAG TPA: hypothetical protein [Podoviridae sp. ctuQh21]
MRNIIKKTVRKPVLKPKKSLWIRKKNSSKSIL